MVGIDVLLYPMIGSDELGAPLYAQTPETVSNVLVGAPDTGAIVSEV